MTAFPLADRLRVLPQYALPKSVITSVLGSLARSKAPFTRHAIPWFIRRYGVNMAEAANADPASYSCFNDFFTRALREGVRPLASSSLVCPVDGAVSQCEPMQGDGVLQVKGHRYSARALLGGDEALAAAFRDGDAVTIYLSPRDYHRIHMPCAGELKAMVHVPGALFSVNPITVQGVPDLFARNERVACLFEASFGPFALVLVGATVVGSMMTSWHGVVTPPRRGAVKTWDYAGQNVRLERGAEMGRFLVGSTVVLLFPRGTVQLNRDWAPGSPVRLGQAMGELAV